MLSALHPWKVWSLLQREGWQFFRLANRAGTSYLRRRMKFTPFLLLPFLCLSPILTAAGQTPPAPATNAITTNDVLVAEKLFGLDLPEDKLKMMLPGLRAQQRDYAVIRQIGVSNSVLPAVLFNPIPSGMTFQTKRLKPEWSPAPKLAAPANLTTRPFIRWANCPRSSSRARPLPPNSPGCTWTG